MKKKIARIVCDPACGFMVQSHDTKEVKKFAGAHAKEMHNMKFTDKDFDSMVKWV